MNDFKFIPDNDHFQKIRLTTIGASDIPILCNLSKYKTSRELWLEKTGRIEPFQGNSVTEWGHRHEPQIIASYIEEITKNKYFANNFLINYVKYSESRPIDWQPTTIFYPFTEFIHPDIKFAMAHPDCLEIENNYIIEAKSHKQFVYDYDEIPLTEYLQIQWQLLCAGLNDAVLRALVNTNEEHTLNVKSNKKIQEKLIEAAQKFHWHMKNDIEPNPVNSDDIKKIFPEVQNKTSYLTDIESEYANKMKSRRDFLQNKIKTYKSEIDDINDGLLLLTRDNKYLYNADGDKICSQVMYEKENLSISDLKKFDENIYTNLKKNDIIKITGVRYVK